MNRRWYTLPIKPTATWWDKRAMQRDKKGRFVSSSLNTRSISSSAPVVASSQKRVFMSTVQAPYEPRMTYSPYPSCCGAGIWHGFSLLPKTKNSEYFIRAFKLELGRMRYAMLTSRNGLVSAIITRTQLEDYPNLHEEMVKAGFNVVHKTGNPNHSYATTLFHYSYVDPHKTASVVSNEEVAAMLNGDDKKKSANNKQNTPIL